MKSFKADLHIHTVLSPCGDLEMSPKKIIKQAVQNHLDIIGIADHNTTRQCEVTKKVGEEHGVYVLCGAEVNTREEVHCLAFFDSAGQLAEFENLMELHLPDVDNVPGKFGYQAVVDENEQILDQPSKLLISAIDIGIEEVERKVHELGGIFIPAHIDRFRNGIVAQLGFIPPALNYDALELSPFANRERLKMQHGLSDTYPLIQSSDAHYLKDIGKTSTRFYMKQAGFEEIKMALKRVNGRKTQLI